MNKHIFRLLSIQWFVTGIILLIVFPYETIVAEPFFTVNDVPQTSNQRLDLTVDLEKIYNASTRPNFSGIWILDPSASDDPREALKEWKKEVSGRRSGGRSGRGSDVKGRERGRGSDNVAGNRSHKMNNGSNKQFEKFLHDELDISHQEPVLKINTGYSVEQKIYTDFRSSSISAKGGVDQLVSIAGWEGNSLFIETTHANGQKSIEQLKLYSNPKRLERRVTLSDQNAKMLHIKQIYFMKNQTPEKHIDMQSTYKF